VILANGEVIQTERISRRELNRRKGLQTLEGEIYRSIDNLIDDNKELVSRLSQRVGFTNAGYCSIASVKGRDGSMDITPLFVGSQGTLGIISEMILKTEYVSRRFGVIVAAFEDVDTAKSCIANIARHDPAFIEYFDSELFEQAARRGKRYDFLQGTGFDVNAVLLIGFDDHGERARGKHIKKVSKLLASAGAWSIDADGDEAEELITMRNALVWAASPDAVGFGLSTAPGGAYIPAEQMDVYTKGLAILAEKYHTSLPVYGRELNRLYYVWPQFNPKRASDKHKMMKFFDDYAILVQKANGELIGDSGEGRLKANAAASGFDVETMQLFADIKDVFDPYGMLNPGVKQSLDVKILGQMIQNDYDIPSLPNHIPYV
jgi:FAD/FMN-containing dehydrogenase